MAVNQIGDLHIVASECPTEASVYDECFHVATSGLLLSLFVQETTGTVDVDIYTLTKKGHQKLIDSFPQITGPTTEILLRKQVEVHDQIRVVITTSDAAKFDIRAKGVEASLASVAILGAEAADNFGILMDTTPRLLIPVSLAGQSNVSIINANPLGGATLYVGFKSTITATNAAAVGVSDPDAATPVPPGGSIGLSVTAGLSVYGLASTGTVDVRIIQLGN